MRKNLTIIWILFWVFLSGITFGWDIFYVLEGQPKFPWIYNPISWFYEPKSQQEIDQEWIESIDLYSDDSIRKFLDDNHPLSTDYEASDIRKIKSDFTSNKSSNFYLRNEVASSFELMAWAFSNAFNFKAKLTINSARRSQAYQRKLAANCSTIRCAKPGTSEHEAGLALDLWVNGWNIKAWSGKYYQRLVDNAHLYGFHNSYQKWMEVDGKMVEPRHWRYVWERLATILHDRGQTFTEFFYQNIEVKNW